MVQHSRPRRPGLTLRDSIGKQQAVRLRGPVIMQRPKDAETVAVPDQLVYIATSQHPQGRRDRVPSMNPRYSPGPKVDHPLRSLHMTRSSPAPDEGAVRIYGNAWHWIGAAGLQE